LASTQPTTTLVANPVKPPLLYPLFTLIPTLKYNIMSSYTSSVTPLKTSLKDTLAFLQFPWQNGLALKSGSMAQLLDVWFKDEWLCGQESREIDTNLLRV
jgi:hypothetical protein